MPKYAELPAFREQNYITEADGDMLRREARALALRRIEESARTEDDFQKVIEWWDKLDENRERRERDHEIGRSCLQAIFLISYLTARKRYMNLSRMRIYRKY